MSKWMGEEVLYNALYSSTYTFRRYIVELDSWLRNSKAQRHIHEKRNGAQ